MSDHANETTESTQPKPVRPNPVRPEPVGNELVYRLTHFWVMTYFRAGGGKIYGRENIPASGRFIFAPNHVSHLDPPLVSSCSPRRPHVMAKSELFKNAVFAKYIGALGAFPVERGKADRKAIRRAIHVLETEAPLLIFPEGTRSKDGSFGEPEIGLAMIAHAAHAPIIPVYVKGTHNAFSALHPGFRLAKIEIYYGEPLLFEEEYSRRADRATLDAINTRTMQELAALRDRVK